MIPRSWDVHQGISEAEGVGFGWRRVAQCCSSSGGGGGGGGGGGLGGGGGGGGGGAT